MLSRSLVIALVVVVVVVVAAVVALMVYKPGLMGVSSSPGSTTTVKPETALASMRELGVGQYTVNYSASVNMLMYYQEYGSGTNVSIAVTTPNIEISYLNNSGSYELYIAGPVSVNITSPSYSSASITFKLPLVVAITYNATTVCMILGQQLINSISSLSGGSAVMPSNYTSVVSCSPVTQQGGVVNTTSPVTNFVNDIYNNLTYVGTETWNGQNAYCFATKMPVSIPLNESLASSLSPGASMNMELYINRMCVLNNGLTTLFQGSINITIVSSASFGEMDFNINANLLNYEMSFDNAAFQGLLTSPYIVSSSSSEASTTSTLQFQLISLTGVNSGQAQLTFLMNNPSNASIGINGFTLGDLSCVFSSPIQIPAGASDVQIMITLPISNGYLNASGVSVTYNGQSMQAICTGQQMVQVGVVYDGYLTTVNGQTYPFAVTASP
ncbi:hypothetical protein [Vulcanisaeta sp. JCM 16159]|uniref:hypothetical protein n=1 Tax=Vulcanisaeta sp. JCM 16159 TaxID=1295371 RepID=UPI0006D2266C|nr:hypothetical protein [Vulcanisaeta sp. JCM 16159]